MRRPEGYQPDASRSPVPTRRDVLSTVLRSGLVVAATSAAYALAPLDREPRWGVMVRLAAWLLALGAVYAWQIRAVARSDRPALRAAEALAVGLPLFVLLFAATHFVTGQADPASFTEPVDRVDALYLAVAVFATVGFGDIAPVTATARLLVTVQMLAGLVVVGVVAKVLVGAVHQRRSTLGPPPPPPGPPPALPRPPSPTADDPAGGQPLHDRPHVVG